MLRYKKGGILMKKFRCSVCGHIHVGDEAPEHCPVCNSPKEKFILIENEEEATISNNIELKPQYFDVVIVGSGAAALSAAITAGSNGLNVIVLEKGMSVGGTSARSGGRYWIPNNKFQKEVGIIDDKKTCLEYMARCAFPTRYDDSKEKYNLPEKSYNLLEAYYDNATKMIDFMEQEQVLESVMDYSWKKQPQVDYLNHLPENKGIRGRTLYPKTEDGVAASGSALIKLLHNAIEKRNIDIITKCQVIDILKNDSNEVIGVEALNNGSKQLFYAKKGVIFGSGGFSHNEDLMRRFQAGHNYGGCAVPENKGDLVKIAEKHGIKLGNMNNAFRAQSMIDMYFDNPDGSSNLFYIIGDSVLQVNKYGKRVMNEKRNYNDRTMKHFVWDENNAQWPNLLMFMIFDSRTATYWQGFPPMPVGDIKKAKHIITGSDLEDLTINIEKYLDTRKDELANFKLDMKFSMNLEDTIKKFNYYAKTGVDEDFGRGMTDYDQEYTTFPPTIPDVEWPPKDSKNITMYPLSKNGPYYAIVLGGGTLDTNGGPIINEHAQMLDYDDKPVEGLYGAGNCISSPGRQAYWGAGSTLGPGMTFGYLAALHAFKSKDKEI